MILAFAIFVIFSSTFWETIYRQKSEGKFNAKMPCYDKAITTYMRAHVLQKTFALGTFNSYQSGKCIMSAANTVWNSHYKRVADGARAEEPPQ